MQSAVFFMPFVLYTSEVEAKSKWNRSRILLKPKWSRSEVEVKSKWHRSEVEVKSKWSRSEIEVKSKCSRSEVVLKNDFGYFRSKTSLFWPPKRLNAQTRLSLLLALVALLPVRFAMCSLLAPFRNSLWLDSRAFLASKPRVQDRRYA